MAQFEAVLPGFDGSTDETDHMIKWGHADSLDQVLAAFPGAQVFPLEDFDLDAGTTDFDFRQAMAA